MRWGSEQRGSLQRWRALGWLSFANDAVRNPKPKPKAVPSMGVMEEHLILLPQYACTSIAPVGNKSADDPKTFSAFAYDFTAVRASIHECVSEFASLTRDVKPAAVVGYSWGGATAVTGLQAGVWDGPTVLLAPAAHLLNAQAGYGARFSTEVYTRGCHWFPRLCAA